MVVTTSKFIDVRTSGQTSKGRKKVYVKGYASTKGLYDTYGWMKNNDGSYKTFKSLFTDECIDDMRKQALSKTIFVDALHTIATDEGIIRMLKEKGADDDEIAEVKTMLNQKKLPIAKPVELDVDDNGFIFAAETNPYFADVDEEHSKYYDAVTNSLLEGYLKAYSINFDPVDYETKVADNGDEETRFSKVNLYGISFTDQPALETNSFTEVAVRSMVERRNSENKEKGGNMTEEKEIKPAEQEAPEVVEPKKEENKVDVDAEIERRAQELADKKFRERDMESKMEDHQKEIKDLNERMDELKTQKGSQPASVVKQEDKFGGQQQGSEMTDAQKKEWYDEKLKAIAEPHLQHMEDLRAGINPGMTRGRVLGGFGELVQLQADSHAHTIRMPGESPEAFEQRIRMIGRNSDDDMVLRRKNKV